jgi:cytochrome b561
VALRNTATAWGWPAQALHWLVAVLVFPLLGIGVAMVGLVSDVGSRFELYQLHKSLGVLVFALVLVRLIWRLLNRQAPALPGGLRPWERRLATSTYFGLYALLLLLPLTGWVMASTSPLGVPTIVFGLLTLPHPIGPNVAVEEIMAWVHAILAALLGLLLLLHIIAALKHHFVLHDDVLARMLPGSRERRA